MTIQAPTSTGQQFDITGGGFTATITEIGAGLRRLSYGKLPLVTEFAPDRAPEGAQGQLLIPWPNRIDHGEYEFDGVRHQLEITEPARDAAIHGLSRWRPWHLVQHSRDRVRLRHLLTDRPGYPFRLELEADYFLYLEGLQVTITATNTGGTPAPYGNGAHPYLVVEDHPIDDLWLRIAANYWLPTDERKIPRSDPQDVAGTPYDFRHARPIGDLAIDNAFTGLHREPDGRAWLTLSQGTAGTEVGLWVDENYEWIEVYTGDDLVPGQRRRGLGAEPMTCPPNGFASRTGVVVLEPGESVTTSWGIEVISVRQGSAG